MRHLHLLALLALLALPSPQPARGAPVPADEPIATFSIVAVDRETGEWGVAVQSKFFAVGSVVPWAKAGVGAVATQAYGNTTFGPRGLEAMAKGRDAASVLRELIGSDRDGARRQIGLVDAEGRAASFTGSRCMAWAGGRIGDGYAAQGNILTGPEVVDAMAETFEKTRGDLASRLLASLRAGQAAGGDRRGRQSAALLVVRKGGGYAGFNDRYLDLRVDDHETPIEELGRLLDLFLRRYGGSPMARAFALHRAGRTASAVAMARTAVRQEPENGEHRYNLACFLALSGKADEAMRELAEALKRQPDLTTLAREDEDLVSLRDRPDFRKLTAADR